MMENIPEPLVIWVGFVAMMGSVTVLATAITFAVLRVLYFRLIPLVAVLLGAILVLDPDFSGRTLLAVDEMTLNYEFLLKVVGALSFVYGFGALSLNRACSTSKGVFSLALGVALLTLEETSKDKLNLHDARMALVLAVGSLVLAVFLLLGPSVTKAMGVVTPTKDYTGF